MRPVIDILEERITAALGRITGQSDAAALVKPATDPKFGDYQVNGVMTAAKRLKANPRQLAEKAVEAVDLSDICLPPEIAGPGFINLRLKTEYVAERLLEVAGDQRRLAVDQTGKPKRIVVDFSSPNIAKQMHVGHLRSTILGDAICRMLEFEGHTVIRQNHIGDWGLQMGMLLYALWDLEGADDSDEKRIKILGDLERRAEAFPAYADSSRRLKEEAQALRLDKLEEHYKTIAERIKHDPEAENAVRKWTVSLQSHDVKAEMWWQKACEVTLAACYSIYDSLGVTLKKADERRESFYADRLAGVVRELKEKGLAVESDGAVCVFPEGFASKDGQPLPFIIQKSDGAFLYATTDLAALKFRIEELKADEIIYVTDARQKLHFEMLFATAKLAGWVPDGVKLEHVMFGTVLGEDNRPLKTRSGENVKLRELLDEAVERARAVVEEKNPQLPEDRKADIARAVGIGAVKYADYSNNRTSDYVFSFAKMLAMDGNTAPYMQYACARVKSIERKAAGKDVDIERELSGIATLNLKAPAEVDLAKHLVRYGEVIENALADFRPNYLTAFLYELAQKFSGFYNTCPVLTAEPRSRPTRLLLCDLTYRTIAHGLGELLGICVVEQM